MPTPLRVLIVEDRPSDAELMVHELEQAGFKPEWQRVEIEADYLAQLRTVPDVILADHTLPQFGAPRALELLQKSGLDIPLIVITGSISEETAVERIKQGAADYILKDRMARLGPAVKRALEEKKLQEEKRQADEALKIRYQELQTLQEISQMILISPDLKTTLEKILSGAVSVGPFDLGTIMLVDSATMKVETAATYGYQNSANVQRQPREETPGRVRYRALIYEKTFIIENTAEHDGLRTLKKEGIQSAILVPVRAGEKTLGFIQIGTRTRQKFEPEKVKLLEAIGHLMGIGVQKSQLFEDTRRNLQRIRALHEIDLAITSILDLRTVLDFLLEKIDLFLFGPAASTVRLLNKDSGLLAPVACRNLNEAVWKAEEGKAGRGLANVVFETKAPLVVRNVQTDPRTRDREFFTRYGLISYLGVPLMAKKEVLGVLGFYTREEHQFTNEEIEFLVTLAGQAAIAIQNAQLYEETNKQAEELRRAIKVKDEFLSVMSHELRTPLNVVMGYAGMMKDGMLGEVNPQQEEALGKMISRANEQLALVNNILYATVLEAEKINVETHEFVLGDFLNQLKSAYDIPTRKEPVILWECAEPLAPIKTDSAKLKLILNNLIDNALKFTKQGSVTISARLTESSQQKADGSSEILPTADRLLPTGYVEFKVADTGVGIPKDQLPLIFERFHQVDSSETRLFGGVGMGLYIVKQFTALLGGTVEVESEPDKGTVFTVTIPVEN